MKSDNWKNAKMTSAEYLDATIELFFRNIERDVTHRLV